MDAGRQKLVRSGLVVLGVALCLVSYPLEFEAKTFTISTVTAHSYATPWTYGVEASGESTSRFYLSGCDSSSESCSQSGMLMSAFAGPLQVVGLLLALVGAFAPDRMVPANNRRGLALGGTLGVAAGFVLLNGGVSRLFDGFLDPAIGLYLQLAAVLCLLAPYIAWLIVRIRNSFPTDETVATPPAKSPPPVASDAESRPAPPKRGPGVEKPRQRP